MAEQTTKDRRKEASDAVKNLGESCLKVFNNPARNIGTATLHQALTFNASTAEYYDAFGMSGTLTLSQTGYAQDNGRPWAGDPTIASYTPTDVIAATAGGVAIYLTRNFYKQQAKDRAITLLHELLHLTYGGGREANDVNIAARFGISYTVSPSEDAGTAASLAISDWLRRDCGGQP
jgi:hypothetical protein